MNIDYVKHVENDKSGYSFLPEDFDICLITKYSIFKSDANNILKRLFSKTQTYGTISQIPFDELFLIHKQLFLTLRYFYCLKGDLIKSLVNNNNKIFDLKSQEGNDFICSLHLKKQRRINVKIKYFDYIYDFDRYIYNILVSKMS